MNVARNVLLDPRLVPGGGATGMCSFVCTCAALTALQRCRLPCTSPRRP